MEDNVYEPPKASLTPEATSFEEEYGIVQVASTGKRFLNFLVDTVGYLVFSFGVGVFLALAGLFHVIENVPELLLNILLMSLYYFPQEATSGRTLGKLVTGTKAVSEDGGPLTAGQALGRTFSRFIPFDGLSFLFGSGFPVGWHDRIPGTKVISIR